MFLIAFFITKAIQDWGEFFGINGKANGKLRNMKNQSFKVLFHKQIRNARRGSKEEPVMKHSWWHSCQTLLEYFLESNLCMLYVISKLKKSIIQCFKRCTIWSWNEGLTAIGSRSLQAKGKFCTAAKSPFCCENVVLLLRNFTTLLHAQLWCSP